MAESIPLSTGRHCMLEDPRLPLLSHYRVLSFPKDQGQPSNEEAEEMLLIATRKGRDLARFLYADEECFSLIFNAGRTRRRPWHHVHILLARSPTAKRLVFMAFYLKHLLRRWPFRLLARPAGTQR